MKRKINKRTVVDGINAIIIWSLIIVNIHSLTFFTFLGDSAIPMEDSRESSCDGIDYFYSGEDFLLDKLRMSEYYDRFLPDQNRSFYDGDGYNGRMQPPKALLDNSTRGYDCEDWAHAVHCLAQEYNYSCQFYTSVTWGRPYPDENGGHLGICCKVNVTELMFSNGTTYGRITEENVDDLVEFTTLKWRCTY